jgi:hypothetical protein
LSTSADRQTVKERFGGEQSLVLSSSNAPIDLIHSVPLGSGFFLGEALGQQAAVFVLYFGIFGGKLSDLTQVGETFVLAS